MRFCGERCDESASIDDEKARALNMRIFNPVEVSFSKSPIDRNWLKKDGELSFTLADVSIETSGATMFLVNIDHRSASKSRYGLVDRQIGKLDTPYPP